MFKSKQIISLALAASFSFSANAFFGGDITLSKSGLLAMPNDQVKRTVYYIEAEDIEEAKKIRENIEPWYRDLTLGRKFSSFDEIPKDEDFPDFHTYKHYFSEDNFNLISLQLAFTSYKDQLKDVDSIVDEMRQNEVKRETEYLAELREEEKTILANNEAFYSEANVVREEQMKTEKILQEAETATETVNTNVFEYVNKYITENNFEVKRFDLKSVSKASMKEKTCKVEGFVYNEDKPIKSAYYKQVNPTLCVTTNFFKKFDPAIIKHLKDDADFIALVDKQIETLVVEYPKMGEWKMKKQETTPIDYSKVLKTQKKANKAAIKEISSRLGVSERGLKSFKENNEKNIKKQEDAIEIKLALFEENIEKNKLKAYNKINKTHLRKMISKTINFEYEKILLDDSSTKNAKYGTIELKHDKDKPVAIILDSTRGKREISFVHVNYAKAAVEYVYDKENKIYSFEKLKLAHPRTYTQKEISNYKHSDVDLLLGVYIKTILNSNRLDQEAKRLDGSDDDEYLNRVLGPIK